MKFLQKLIPWLPILGFLPLILVLIQPGSNAKRQSFFYDAVIPDTKFGPDREAVISPSQVVRVGEWWKQIFELRTDGVSRFAHAAQIGIQLANTEEIQSVKSATLQLELPAGCEGPLVYQTKSGAKLTDFLVLDMNSEIKASNSPGGVEFGSAIAHLTVLSSTNTEIRLKATFSNTEPVSRQLYGQCKPPSKPVGVGSIFGWIEPDQREDKRVPRIDLIAYLWGLSKKETHCLFYALTVLLSITVFIIVKIVTRNEVHLMQWIFPLATGCMLLCLGLLYAIITPPLQGPDESDHLLTAYHIMGEKKYNEKVTILSQFTHFERIKFRESEKFTGSDINITLPQGLASHSELLSPNRSPVSFCLWSHLGRILNKLSAMHALLIFRILGISFMSATTVISLLIISQKKEKTLDALSLLLIFYPPSIVFFATMHSNYTFVIGGFLMQAFALCEFWRSPKNEKQNIKELWFACLAGCGTSLAAFAGDIGYISFFWWLILLPCWLLTGQGIIMESWQPYKQALVICFSYLAGNMIIPFFILLGSNEEGHLSERLRTLLEKNNTFCFANASYLSISIIMFLIYAAILVLLSIFFIKLKKIKEKKISVDTSFIIISFFMIIMIFIGSGEIKPLLPRNESMPWGSIPVIPFLRSLGQCFLSGLILPDADWYVSGSFWGYLGWLDTPLPKYLVLVIRYIYSLGILFLFISILFNKQKRPNAILFGGIWLAIGGSLIAIGFMGLVTGNQVHGRYLVGPYILIITLAIEGYRQIMSKIVDNEQIRLLISSSALSCLFIIHGLSLHTLIKRYF